MDEVPSAPRTFADLDRRGEEVEVTCQRCSTAVRLTGSSKDRFGRSLVTQTIVGRRFTCSCGGIGLPTIKRRWVESLSAHGRARATRLLRS